MYYDIGNHWKYGQPGDWIRAFGHRCVKLDIKGFSRADDKFTDIGEGDLPWDQVRKALDDIEFTGWATAEVGGGTVERLTVVRKQMEKLNPGGRYIMSTNHSVMDDIPPENYRAMINAGLEFGVY